MVYSKSGEQLKDDLGIAVGVVGFLGLVYASNYSLDILIIVISRYSNHCRSILLPARSDQVTVELH